MLCGRSTPRSWIKTSQCRLACYCYGSSSPLCCGGCARFRANVRWQLEAMATILKSAACEGGTSQKTAEMTERPWQALTGLRPDTNYPARANLEGEGIVVFRTKSGFRGFQR